MIFIGFYIFVIPFCTLMHEIGHAIGEVLTSDNITHVHLGSIKDTNKKTFKIGRMHFHLKWSYYGYCVGESRLNDRQRLITLVGGPLMSLIMAVIFSCLMNNVPQGDLQILLSGASRFSIISFFSTAVPIKYPRWMGLYSGHPSDGLQIFNLMKKRRSKQ